MSEWVSRRSVMATLGAAGAAAIAPAARAQPLGLPIGLELYGIGDALAHDPTGTLNRIVAIGYRGVEIPSFYGVKPAQLRSAFAGLGLACVSGHIQVRSMFAGAPSLEQDPDKVIADCREAGLTYIVSGLAPVPDARMPKAGDLTNPKTADATIARMYEGLTLDDWKWCADLMNRMGERTRVAGLTLCYHNHNIEFQPYGGRVGYDVLLAETDPALVKFEMDVGWVVAGGRDPARYLRAHPGRFPLLHIKDLSATTKANWTMSMIPADLGEGMIDWREVFAAARVGGVKHYFVEQEPPFPHGQLDAAAKAYAFLDRLRL